MKKIEAVIRVDRFSAVRNALEQQGYAGMTAYRVEGHGRQKGIVQQFRGREYKVELLPKMKLELVVHGQSLEPIVNTIVQVAQTGEIGDGKIFISSVEDTVRIRTGERGPEAL